MNEALTKSLQLGTTSRGMEGEIKPHSEMPRWPRCSSFRIIAKAFRRPLFLILPGLLALVLGTPVFAGGEINANEAIRLAEEFVRANGYTDAPPTKEFRDPESFQRSPEKLRLTGPQRLLKPRAWGFRRGSRSDLTQGWTVIFLIVQKPLFKMRPNETAYGQEVEMDRYGKRLIVLHGVNVAYDNMDFPGFTKRRKGSGTHS